MKRFILLASFFLLGTAGTAIAQQTQSTQKGVDTQTRKIKDDAQKVTSREHDVGRSFDWGKDKTKVRDRLDNPFRFSIRRDALLEFISQALQEKRILIDEAASRMKEGVVITQPFVFAKGPVTTKGELIRFGVVQFEDTAWSRGQYTLTIEVQPIDGAHNNVSVIAKVEGLSGSGLMSEWRTVPSSGLAEDDFLAKLVELVTGKSPDAQPQR